MSFENHILYEDNTTESPTPERTYSLRSLKEMTWDYVTDATSSARSEDRFRITKFLDWVEREEKSLKKRK